MYFQNVFALEAFYFGTQRVEIFVAPRKQMQSMMMDCVAVVWIVLVPSEK